MILKVLFSILIAETIELSFGFLAKRSELIQKLNSLDPNAFDRIAITKDFGYSLSLAVDRLKNDRDDSLIFMSKIQSILNTIEEFKSNLALVGEYMFEHKFYERDWKSTSGFRNRTQYINSMLFRTAHDPFAKFMFSFSTSMSAKEEHADVNKNCAPPSSSLNCITYISSFVKLSEFLTFNYLLKIT
jgi:hypothetical protein